MSAFVVCKTHIDLLVQTAIEGPQPERITPDSSWSLRRPRWFTKPPAELRDRPLEDLRAAVRHPDHDRADEIGQMLLLENVRSVRYRYPDMGGDGSLPGPVAEYWREPYTFTRPGYRLSPVEALAALACYEYQTCEHPDWFTSEAYQFCDALRGGLIRSLPGYDQAPWEWTPERITEHQAGTVLVGR